MILPFINIRKVPRDHANVNDWKIIFDPFIIIINKVPLYALKTLGITLGFKTEGDTPGFQIFLTDLGLVWFQEGLVWVWFREV